MGSATAERIQAMHVGDHTSPVAGLWYAHETLAHSTSPLLQGRREPHRDPVSASRAAGACQSVPLGGWRQLAGEAVAARLIDQVPPKDRGIIAVLAPCAAMPLSSLEQAHLTV